MSATLIQNAIDASKAVATSNIDTRNAFLLAFAENLVAGKAEILKANEADVNDAQIAKLSSAMCDRLGLVGSKFDSMIESIKAVATLADPIGNLYDQKSMDSGIEIAKMRMPLGLVCFVYESRPSVTADGAALCIKSGNAVILRGGKEALRSNLAIIKQANDALVKVGLPKEAISMPQSSSRDDLNEILSDERIEMVIPRGGAAFVAHVKKIAKAMVLAHVDGNCHIYVDKTADLKVAQNIIVNSKTQRPGTCNALESLVVDRNIAKELLDPLAVELKKANVVIRGCSESCDIIGADCKKADEADWTTEYLDLIISIKIVADLNDAILWINKYGSHHTDCIVSKDEKVQGQFQLEVDSSSVLINTSTRFADGFEYGLGAETGISTGKFHARGPVGLEGLTTYKWIATSNGAIRN